MAQNDQEIDAIDLTGLLGNSPAGLEATESSQGPALGPHGSDAGNQRGYDTGSAASGTRLSSPGPLDEAMEPGHRIEDANTASLTGRTGFHGRWTVITIVGALLLSALLVAGIILVTRPRATIDQLLILTVPSGADVSFDGKPLGPSPVKLEGVRMGTHKVVVTKDGYQELQSDETITESRNLDYKLKLSPPPGSEGLPEDLALNQYKQNMEDAFNRGDYAIPYYGRSALYFAQLILDSDNSNAAALDMKDRVRNALVQSAHAAMSRVDLAQAQEIVYALGLYFPNDEDARAAAAKLENQIAIHRSDVRELIRKAEDALRSGNLIDPPRASAYYYSKQALTLDRQNQRARAIKIQVRDGVLQSIEQTAIAGNLFQATREVEQALKLFPEDAQLQAKQKDLEERQSAEAKANDPSDRRLRGLDGFRDGRYAEAIQDLEFAFRHGHREPEVLSALGMSYKKLRDFQEAAYYFGQVRPSSEDSYTSAQGALGDIAAELENYATAREHYKKALDLGGSASYPPAILEDKIEKLEKKQSGRVVVDPTPLTIQVRHLHGGILQRSCVGSLTVNNGGVRFDSTNGDHVFAANLLRAGVRINKDQLGVSFQGKNETFKPTNASDVERFYEAVTRYRVYESAQK